jgi:hypothetical protein
VEGNQYKDCQNKINFLEMFSSHIFISFRVIVLQSEPAFTPKYLKKEGANEIGRELIDKETKTEQNMNKFPYTRKQYIRNLFNKPRLSWSDPK